MISTWLFPKSIPFQPHIKSPCDFSLAQPFASLALQTCSLNLILQFSILPKNSAYPL